MDGAQLQAVFEINPRNGRMMIRILRMVLENGPRSRNILTGLNASKDPKGVVIDLMLMLGLLVAKGARRGTVYDVPRHVREVARSVPLLNPAG